MRRFACQSSHQLCETGRQSPVAAASCAIKGLDRRGRSSCMFSAFYPWQNPLWHQDGIRFSTRFFPVDRSTSNYFELYLICHRFVVSKPTCFPLTRSYQVLRASFGMQKYSSIRLDAWSDQCSFGWHTARFLQEKSHVVDWIGE
eukprot:s168_g39.t1